MSSRDSHVAKIVDDAANALQLALLLAGQLATELRAQAYDASNLYEAVARASDAHSTHRDHFVQAIVITHSGPS